MDATRHLAEAACEGGAGLVHVSTDAVFSGDGSPRDEQAPTDPVWDDGRWKADASRAVAEVDAAAAIVRLPLVVSIHPADHAVAQISRGAADATPTRWSPDERRQPARATEPAGALWAIASLAGAARGGTWHLPGPERLSRAEIAQRVVRALHLDPTSIVVEPTPRSALRPRDLNLTCERVRRVLGWHPSPILSPTDGHRPAPSPAPDAVVPGARPRRGA